MTGTIARKPCIDNPVKTSCDSNGLLIENAAQRLTGEVAQALAARRSAHLDMLAIAHETDLSSLVPFSVSLPPWSPPIG